MRMSTRDIDHPRSLAFALRIRYCATCRQLLGSRFVCGSQPSNDLAASCDSSLEQASFVGSVEHLLNRVVVLRVLVVTLSAGEHSGQVGDRGQEILRVSAHLLGRCNTKVPSVKGSAAYEKIVNIVNDSLKPTLTTKASSRKEINIMQRYTCTMGKYSFVVCPSLVMAHASRVSSIASYRRKCLPRQMLASGVYTV